MDISWSHGTHGKTNTKTSALIGRQAYYPILKCSWNLWISSTNNVWQCVRFDFSRMPTTFKGQFLVCLFVFFFSRGRDWGLMPLMIWIRMLAQMPAPKPNAEARDNAGGGNANTGPVLVRMPGRAPASVPIPHRRHGTRY